MLRMYDRAVQSHNKVFSRRFVTLLISTRLDCRQPKYSIWIAKPQLLEEDRVFDDGAVREHAQEYAQEYAHEQRRGHTTYLKLLLNGLFSVSWLLITSVSQIRRLRQPKASDERYVRPPRRFEFPETPQGLRPEPSHSRYLRATRYCNPWSPQVTAIAHSLGAHRLPDLEYAQAAFAFAKEELTLEIAPIDSVEASLERGTGTCFDLISVFIALCRAAGIPARYKIFATEMIQTWRESVIDVDPLVQKWYDSLGYFLLEGEGEAYVDGQWMVAHVGPTAKRQAAAGIPITRFGEDALGTWFHAKPGTIMRLEAIPPGLAAGSRLLHKISPGSMERINISVQKQISRGLQVLANAGGLEAYDQQARQTKPTDTPD